MLFNTLEYLLFFLGALGLCWALVALPRTRIVVLLLASYYFYASNNGWLILLIILSTQVDYLAGLGIHRATAPGVRKSYLWLSVATNLSILGLFKYANFFADSVSALATTIGWRLSWTDVNILLPVGISFYTFQSMSYTIDIYRGRITPERSWIRFAFYVTYFPQLIAGPIMRASQFLPQVRVRPRFDPARFEGAVLLIMQGLFKKIVLGDFLGRYADMAFAQPQQVGTLMAWVGVYAFTFQIYFDFSGYSDIAIGCSRLMGFELPDNFRRPYMASSFSDFWKRWHISLSSWLRDYMYIPLGGNRMATSAGVYRNLMLTMLLGGLWHGAAWHFVVWGFLHGSYLCIERAFGRPESVAAAGWLRRGLVFQGVVLTWLVFRCETLADVGHYLVAMVRLQAGSGVTLGLLAAILVIVGGLGAQWVGEHRNWAERFLGLSAPVKGAAYAAATVTIVVFNASGATPFLYFRF